MKQQTFSDIEYSNRKRKTKREEFLEIMDEIIPWDEWASVIEPYYPRHLITFRLFSSYKSLFGAFWLLRDCVLYLPG